MISSTPPKTVKCAPSICRPSHRNRSSHGQRPPALLNRSMPISAKSTAVIFLSSSTVSVSALMWSHSATKAQRPNKWSNISEFFFSNAGAPLTFWSDNGPQFGAAEFRSFLADWGITALTSSSHYAQSNGRTESEINTMKSLIHGSWTSGAFNAAKFDKSILLSRNAPRSGGASPAKLIFNRPVRDCLPAHRRSFAPE